MKRKGILYVVSAPSGAGKTSICREVVKAFLNLRDSISYTTRKKRAGEREGIDYHFVSQQTFDEMVAEGRFVEWARVHGNCYGTAQATLDLAREAGQDLLLEIDFQGAAQLRESGMDGVFIFILPPDLNELQRRLDERNTDTEEVIARRMQNARKEIAQAVLFDYIVVNDEFELAVRQVKAIMIAETARAQRVLEGLPEEFNLKSSS